VSLHRLLSLARCKGSPDPAAFTDTYLASVPQVVLDQ